MPINFQNPRNRKSNTSRIGDFIPTLQQYTQGMNAMSPLMHQYIPGTTVTRNGKSFEVPGKQYQFGTQRTKEGAATEYYDGNQWVSGDQFFGGLEAGAYQQGGATSLSLSPAATGSFAAGNVIGGANPILISSSNPNMKRTLDQVGRGFGGFRAEGGPVEGGKSYIVGEDGVEYYVDEEGNKVPVGLLGAELIEAPKDGFIIPNQDSQGFSNALLGQVTPTITAQIPGIENITLGQAPIVSQGGIQYQTPERGGADINVKESIADAWNESVLNQKMKDSFGQQVFGVGNDQYQIRNKFFGIVGDQIPYSEASPQAKSEAMKAYFLGGITERPVGQTYEQAVAQQEEQVAPTIQSIAGVEQAQEQSLQPDATFTLPSGEVRSIMSGQDVASAFGRESGRPMTFQVDGGEVTVPSAQAIQTMNLGEQAAARQAQQEFLASPAAREMSNRMLRSVMYNDPYAQASAERVARMEAKPDFNRAVSDRERRGTGEMSMASATKLTGGDKDKARAMIELQRQGRDPMTGKEVEEPFEPKEIEISGKKYIQYTPNYIQPVEEPKAPKKSEIESIREEGVKAGLPENLIRQSIASKLGLDIYDEGVKNWMAGNTDTVPSVEGASESSTFDPTSLTGQDKEAYDWAMANPNAPQSAQILARLSK